MLPVIIYLLVIIIIGKSIYLARVFTSLGFKMTAITLCTVVKNEFQNIRDYLGRIINSFDEAIIVDTGSNDGTVELLQEEFRIDPLHFPTKVEEFFSVVPARNFGLTKVQTPYVLVVDADEFLEDEEIPNLYSAIAERPNLDGFYLPWITHNYSETPIVDCKLHLFKSSPEIYFTGMRHMHVTPSIRKRGGRAEWVDATMHHYPDWKRLPLKKKLYLEHLEHLVKSNPSYYRHHWFLGMTLYKMGRMKEAIAPLNLCAKSRSTMFPVEVLNSHMYLAEIYARKDQYNFAIEMIDLGLRFFHKVKDDFEVEINEKIQPALVQMKCDVLNGKKPRAYEFAR